MNKASSDFVQLALVEFYLFRPWMRKGDAAKY
jgi:hypothetical protein